MIRLIFCVLCWVVLSLVAAVVGFPALFVTGRVDVLWAMSLWAATTGYRLAGIRPRTEGREKLDGRAYLFMANHVSNLDPPIITAMLQRRIAIITKKELFRIPLFGRAMYAARFVAVDRSSRRSAIDSIRDGVKVLRSGMGMMVFPEGTRSSDGKLLPFKKGPFHLAMEAGVPVMPITIVGSREAWAKGKMAMHSGEVVVKFHDALDPQKFATKEELMAAVYAAINSGLPEQYRRPTMAEPASH